MKKDYVEVDLDDIQEQPDDYSTVKEPKVWTLKAMIEMANRTANRFSFSIVPDTAGKVAEITYVNYDKTKDGKLKVWIVHKPKQNKFLGAAMMLPRVTKKVAVE